MTNAVNLSALGSNGGTSVSTWTTGTRPASPITGQTGFNTTLGSLESYNGSAWVSGGGLNTQAVQTTGFTAVAGNIYPCNTTSAAFTVTLPASPTAGNQVQIIDYAGTFATNNLTLGRNSSNITGVASNYVLITNRESVILTYIDATQGWVVSSAAYTTSPLTVPPYSVEFLLIAGGASGGTGTTSDSAGGGGAGGLVPPQTATVSSAVSYTVTVGAGGATQGSSGSHGNSGSNTIVTGSGISLTTAVGGGYGCGETNSARVGGNGGSGGGAGGFSGSAGSGTAGQGNNGGPISGSGAGSAGGGGGAGAASTNINGGAGSNTYSTWASATSTGRRSFADASA